MRFHDDIDGSGSGAEGASAEAAAAGAGGGRGAPLPPSLSSGRRGRVGSLDHGRLPPPGAAVPVPATPPSLAASFSGGATQGGRLKRFYSQPSILDPEDINSLMSR